MKFFEEKLTTLFEAYKLDNVDDIISALQNKQIGVKINKKHYESANKQSYRVLLANFLENCDDFNIKEKAYPVQFLFSHSSPETLQKVINNDGTYTYLSNYKKPWVKQLETYNDFINSTDFNEALWHSIEKEIQDNQNKHGKVSKGSGNLKDVKVLYPKDENGWELLQPTSFEGEKAAAFYGKEGEKQTPTEWCTRADERYYNIYTKASPLYIIRNWKTGKSYQTCFTKGGQWDLDSNEITVHFLDHNDKKGDEITTGDLSNIPDALLKCIVNPIGGYKYGKSLLDFKNAKREEVNKDKKGYVDSRKTTFGKKTYVRNENVLEVFKQKKRAWGETVTNKIKNIYGTKVCKEISKNGAYEDKNVDKLSKYYNSKSETIDVGNFKEKAGLRKYYFEKKPDVFIIAANTKKRVDPLYKTNGDDLYSNDIVYMLSDIYHLDVGNDVIQKDIFSGTTGIVSKQWMKQTENVDLIREKNKKILKKLKEKYLKRVQDLGYVDFNYNSYHPFPKKMSPNDAKYDSPLMVGKHIYFYRSRASDAYSLSVFINEGEAFKKENIKLNSEVKNKEEIVDIAWEIMQDTQREWRRAFGNEITMNRAEGNYKKNMYEEVRIFDY